MTTDAAQRNGGNPEPPAGRTITAIIVTRPNGSEVGVRCTGWRRVGPILCAVNPDGSIARIFKEWADFRPQYEGE